MPKPKPPHRCGWIGTMVRQPETPDRKVTPMRYFWKSIIAIGNACLRAAGAK